jgi:hypothetical protein
LRSDRGAGRAGGQKRARADRSPAEGVEWDHARQGLQKLFGERREVERSIGQALEPGARALRAPGSRELREQASKKCSTISLPAAVVADANAILSALIGGRARLVIASPHGPRCVAAEAVALEIARHIPRLATQRTGRRRAAGV